jgi:hypothetical protein
VLAKKASPNEDDNHIHNLVRVNLQACSECGHFVVTTYERTESGDLVLKELELDLKVKSSRIRPYPSADDQRVPATESVDRKKILEETCW